MLRRLAVSLGLLICLLALAPAAGARTVPRGFLGVVADGRLSDGSVPLASQVSRMARDGVETLGYTFDWAAAQPYPSWNAVPPAQRARFVDQGGIPTDFSVSDSVVAAAAAHGIGVYPTIAQAPGWAALNPGRAWSPPIVPPYAAFSGDLAHRYGPGGSFWAAHPKLHPIPIRVWQIWNEPVGGRPGYTSNYWDDNYPFQGRYVQMLQQAGQAIKSVDPGAKIVIAGLVGFSWKTLQLLYDTGAKPYFDALALHPYTACPCDVYKIIQFNREVMNKNGDAAKPIYISEIGYPATNSSAVHRQGYRRVAKAEAYWLATAFRSLLARRHSLGIAQMLWYTWMGNDTAPNNAFDYAGLLHYAHGSITPKPALGAFYSTARRVER